MTETDNRDYSKFIKRHIGLRFVLLPLAISAVLAIFITIYVLNPSLVFATHVDYINVKDIVLTYLFYFVFCAVPLLILSGVICLIKWIVWKMKNK